MDLLGIARALAVRHPNARMPCPVCANSVNGENLDRHLEKMHAGVDVPLATRWRGKGFLGIAPCSLELTANAIVLHHTLGLRRRIVSLPCRIEIGSTIRERPQLPGDQEYNSPSETVRSGSYVRLVGERAITIGCRQDTLFAEHWSATSWTRGRRRRSVDIAIARAALVALEYAFVQRGMLAPAS